MLEWRSNNITKPLQTVDIIVRLKDVAAKRLNFRIFLLNYTSYFCRSECLIISNNNLIEYLLIL